MAVATDAMICTINFSVSFFVMVLMFNVQCLIFNVKRGGALRPRYPCGLVGDDVVVIVVAVATTAITSLVLTRA